MNERVTLAQGAGGRQTSELIERIFKTHFANPALTADDAAVLRAPSERMAMTTDGFIVSPPFFPGGDIGKLAVCGTVNDLTCMGAKPWYLSCAFIIEEGFPLKELEKIAASLGETAREAGVSIAAGDTKVVGKGQADGVFITTTGVGQVLPGVQTAGNRARPGDAVLVSGDIGRHGCTILLARDDFGLEAGVTSDCAPLWRMMEPLFREARDIHVVRDATRGGVGTVLYEIAAESGVGIQLASETIPVTSEVSGVCRLLGLEPLYLACEGRMVVIVSEEEASEVLAVLHRTEEGKGAARIGTVTGEHPGRVVLETEIGAKTFLPEPGGELLPRIC